jgi:hypothetical protein
LDSSARRSGDRVFEPYGLPAPGDLPDATANVGVAALHPELAATSLAA